MELTLLNMFISGPIAQNQATVEAEENWQGDAESHTGAAEARQQPVTRAKSPYLREKVPCILIEQVPPVLPVQECIERCIINFGYFAEEDHDEHVRSIHTQNSVRKNEKKEAFEVGSCDTRVDPDAVVVKVIVALITNTAMLGASQFWNFTSFAFVTLNIVYAVVRELLILLSRQLVFIVYGPHFHLMLEGHWLKSEHVEVRTPAKEYAT